MSESHQIILVAGVLCLLALFAAQASIRIGMPMLLAFVGIGMLAGEDGPGGIQFNDFQIAYFVGSLALAAILFEGGLNTHGNMLRKALLPSMMLGTVGVAVSAGLVGTASVLLFHISWPEALLLGAVTVPTDAAAVGVLLRLSRAPVPSRVAAALEIESGLNDPMSVFLTVSLVEYLMIPESASLQHAALVLLEEMGGGAVIGLASGYVLLWVFRSLRIEPAAFPVLALGGALTVFGGAQVVGASGFLAVYIAGIVVANYDHPAGKPVGRFFETLGWLAQISLFLMLGLLVTPHQLPPVFVRALLISAVLIVLARPAGVFISLAPFRWTMRENLFVAWAGLRGAVPIYLTIIPALAGFRHGDALFNVVFVVVIVSVIVQGWTLTPIARLLRLKADPGHE
jgi:potassium/hydrogen antiporter